MMNGLINSLRGSDNLDDQQLVSRFDRLQRLASAQACLNEEGAQTLANLREVVSRDAHRLRLNRQWLQMSAMAQAQSGRAS
jgi:hypothetical protein